MAEFKPGDLTAVRVTCYPRCRACGWDGKTAAPAPDPDPCPDCGHPWASHAAGGCILWPRDAGPCTCKRERLKVDDGGTDADD